jgi:hypothetical protein
METNKFINSIVTEIIEPGLKRFNPLRSVQVVTKFGQ